MSLRAKIYERAAPHLPPGETYLVSSQAQEPLLWRGSVGLLPWPRVVVVTDKRLHLFTSSPWRICDPGRLVGSFPLSELSLSRRLPLRYAIHLSGRLLWVGFAYRDLLEEALAHCQPRAGARVT